MAARPCMHRRPAQGSMMAMRQHTLPVRLSAAILRRSITLDPHPVCSAALQPHTSTPTLSPHTALHPPLPLSTPRAAPSPVVGAAAHALGAVDGRHALALRLVLKAGGVAAVVLRDGQQLLQVVALPQEPAGRWVGAWWGRRHRGHEEGLRVGQSNGKGQLHKHGCTYRRLCACSHVMHWVGNCWLT